MDTQQELQKVLAPYLGAMRKAVGAFWPSLDPELCLIHWLCIRNNLKPPYGMSLQKNSAQNPDPFAVLDRDKFGSRGLSPDGVSTASPLTLPELASERDTPASAMVTPQPPNKPAQRTWMRPEAKYSRRNVPTDAQPRPATSCEVASPDKKAIEPPRSKSVQDVTSQDNEEFKDFDERPLGLRSLGIVSKKVVDDAKRHGHQVQDLQWHEDGLREVIHTMRHSLRGKFIANVPLLSLDVLSVDEQERIVGKVGVKNFEAGMDIVQEGEVGDKLYIVERGSCLIYKMLDGVQTFVKKIEKEDFFGELAVMYDVPRAATVVADTDVTVLTLSRKDLFSTINTDRLDRMRRVARAQFLSGIALFQPLNLKQKVAVAEHLKSRVWHPGEVITRQNEHLSGETQCMYIIEDGDCGVVKQAKGKEGFSETGDVHVMHPGQSFGMLGLLYGAPRAATITAMKGCKTLSISYDQLMSICGDEQMSAMRTAVRGHLLRRIPIFRRVGEEVIHELTKRLTVVHHKRWQPIFMEGDQAKSILVMEEGSCIEHHGNINELKEWRFRSHEAPVEEHNNPGTHFGVEAVTQTGDSRFDFTLVAITECTVLEISRELIRSLLPAPTRMSQLDMRAYRA